MTTEQRTKQRWQQWLDRDQTRPREPEPMTKKGWLKLAAWLVGSLALVMALASQEGGPGPLIGAMAWAMILIVFIGPIAAIAALRVWLEKKKEEWHERRDRKSGRA